MTNSAGLNPNSEICLLTNQLEDQWTACTTQKAPRRLVTKNACINLNFGRTSGLLERDQSTTRQSGLNTAKEVFKPINMINLIQLGLKIGLCSNCINEPRERFFRFR